MTSTPAAGTPPAPVPPGGLTTPPTASQTLDYLEVLGRWSTALRATLDRLDADSQLASDPDVYTADITLAMSLWRSIDARRAELVGVWDSGRVGSEELARISILLWGRLPDPLGAASAFTLPEAGTLAAALADRLTAALGADAIAGSGAAAGIVSVRAAIVRCRAQAKVLGIAVPRLDELARTLEAAVDRVDRDAITTTVRTVDAEVATIERDLIKETGRRAASAHLLAELIQQYPALQNRGAEVEALAERCRSRIAGAPQLAVPSVTVLGPPPADPMAVAATAEDWSAARTELDRYASRFEQCRRALDVAAIRFGDPLERRDDLRGLLGAYRTRAARGGLAEDAAITALFRTAHDALWAAPCDLDAAEHLVERYLHEVRAAVGAETAVEPDADPGTRPPGATAPTADIEQEGVSHDRPEVR